MIVQRHVGRRIPRREDERFLRGRGRYLDDIELPGLLHAAIVRSQVAHGRLLGVDRSGLDVRVDLVLGPGEVRARAAGPVPVVWVVPGQRDIGHPLVGDNVRYVGEPVGVIVAASRYAAEDAVDQLYVEVEELPVVADAEAALGPNAPLLYPAWGTNVAAELENGDSAEHTEPVFASAHRTIRGRMRIGRLAGLPMEARGIIAVPDPGSGRLTVWTSTQAPHSVKDSIAKVLGLPHDRIRVIGPDVGGGFGVKDHIYEDELLVCLAALELGRPVKWVEDRRESLIVTAQARDHVQEVEIAYDLDGTLLGLRTHGTRDTGANLSIFGPGPHVSVAANLPGPYRWRAVRATGAVVVTNKVPAGAYRGFGQPQAVMIRERAVDMVADDLGLDPVDLRRRNLLGPEELPHTTRMSLTYENGDYPAALEQAAALIRSVGPGPDDGRSRGIGFASYVELSAVGPAATNKVLGVNVGTYETATVRMDNDGSVRVYTGCSPHGQGHETSFAQIAADQLGVPLERVSLIHSDTDVTPYSPYGTAASRSIALGGGALHRAAERLADKLRRIAAERLEAAAEDIVLADGRAVVAGTEVGAPLAELAEHAWRGYDLPDGMEPGLLETFVLDPENLSFSYATHACQVAVDRDTGLVEVERFVVAHDCGTIVNPLIVEGQIHGGVAQGLGSALFEEVVFSENGQPLTTTLLDYLIPTSSTVPDIEIAHTEHASPHIPGGMKGMGEGGTIGAPAAILNAVAQALPEIAERITDIPLTPSRLWELLHPDADGG
jgi:aerobic carbon-monoxide dehydrogenase large subunit